MSVTLVDKPYSDYWKNLGTLLVYRHPGFQFKGSVIITDLDNCLLSHITTSKFYDTRNVHEIELYDEDLIKQLVMSDASIVIISNHISRNKLNIDMIKRSVDYFVAKTGIHVLGLFALCPNCLSKPHTGSWRFLNGYYKQHGNATIRKAIVVSNNGGLVVEKERRTGFIENHVAYTDTDRAFAHNIGIEFYAIDEYLDLTGNNTGNPHHGKKVKFEWNRGIIAPDVRLLYRDKILEMPHTNIFRELDRFKNKDSYLIMIMGAPRCGKTKLANDIIAKWQASSFGDNNAVQKLSRETYTKTSMYKAFCRLITNRISVVIDGTCNTRDQRNTYLEFVKNKSVGILFIEVSIGHEMAKVFNHATVEDANDENIMLYNSRDYIIYKSSFERPKPNECPDSFTLMYYPAIEHKKSIMLNRY